MHEENLEISINPSYNADEFIDDLKAELEGEIDALLACTHYNLQKDVSEIEHKIAVERIRIVREIMKRLNLKCKFSTEVALADL